MTLQEVNARINGLDAWVAHITQSTDALHDLVLRIAAAGEQADKRIAELAVAQATLATAQAETAKALKAYLASITRTNGGMA
jgi:ABC-type transporter Mla subunit MlaD